MSRIASRIDAYEKEKKRISAEVQRLIKEANNLISKSQYFNAFTALQKAQKRDVTNKYLKERIDNLIAYMEEHKERYLNQINEFLKAGRGKKAEHLYSELALIAPNYPGLRTLQDEIRRVSRKELLSKISKLESQKKYYTAFKTLQDSNHDGLGKQITRISSKGKKYYYGKAKAHLKSREIYLAYIASMKAKELAPKDIRVFQIHKKCEDLVRKEIQKYIAVLAFDGPANDPDAGKLFSGALISRLFKALPYGINIVEREKIDMLVNENQMKLQNIGSLLGVDMIITGNVSLFKADKTVSEAMASAKIKIGEEEKPNPEFTQMLQIYGKKLDKWPHKPPMTYKEDKFEGLKDELSYTLTLDKQYDRVRIHLEMTPEAYATTTDIGISIEADSRELNQVVEQLAKMVDVVSVKRLDPMRTMMREMLLIKVDTSDPMAREETLRHVNTYHGLILNIEPDSLIAEITGEPGTIDEFIGNMSSIGIEELSRTGVTALEKGRLKL